MTNMLIKEATGLAGYARGFEKGMPSVERGDFRKRRRLFGWIACDTFQIEILKIST